MYTRAGIASPPQEPSLSSKAHEGTIAPADEDLVRSTQVRSYEACCEVLSYTSYVSEIRESRRERVKKPAADSGSLFVFRVLTDEYKDSLLK